jgi:hypothetical protein
VLPGTNGTYPIVLVEQMSYGNALPVKSYLERNIKKGVSPPVYVPYVPFFGRLSLSTPSSGTYLLKKPVWQYGNRLPLDPGGIDVIEMRE